jgi:hypothetical protein
MMRALTTMVSMPAYRHVLQLQFGTKLHLADGHSLARPSADLGQFSRLWDI